MQDGSLAQALSAITDPSAQQQFIQAHRPRFDERVAHELKAHADQYLRSDLHRSLEFSRLLILVFEITNDPLYHALGLLAEANAACIGLGEYQRAVTLYDRAAEIYQALGQPAQRARAHVGKVWALASLGRYDEAFTTGEWANGILQAHAEWTPLATLTMNLAAIHGRLGQDVKTLELLDRAREIYVSLGEDAAPGVALVEQNRAIVLRNLGRFAASVQASKHAGTLLHSLGQKVEAARAQQNLAVTYFVLGLYNDALAILDTVRQVFLDDGRRRDAMLVDLFVSDILLQLRRFNQALEKCRRVRALFSDLGSRFEVAQAILNEAMAYAGLKRYDLALRSLDDARGIFEQEGNQVWAVITDLERAALLYLQGAFAGSLKAARESVSVFKTHNLPVREAQANLIGARAALALQEYDAAQALTNEAVAIAEGTGLPTLRYQCHHLLGILASTRHDPQSALKEFEQAITHVERLRGLLMVEYRADFLQDKQAVYEDAVALCIQQADATGALNFAERARSRALVDLLAYRLDLGLRARSSADTRLIEELTDLRTERDRLYRRLETREAQWADAGGAGSESSQTRRDILDLEDRVTELWHRLLVRNADYARDAALWQVRTEPVQPYLDPATLLVEYFAVQDHLFVFLVSTEHIEVRRISTPLPQILNLIRRALLNLQTAPHSATVEMTRQLTKNFQGIAGQLYEILIAPIAHALDAYARLIFVPYGPLHYFPLHALYDGHCYLLSKYALSYLPSASLLSYLQQDRVSPPAHAGQARALVMGHSYGGRLPHTLAEAGTIATLFKTEPVLDADATVARLKTQAPDAQVLHLATHGEFRPDHPLFSGLAFADQWLTLLDIFNLRLNASIVTLSACETGRSVIGGGDELLGLMRAFLYAGASSLLLCLWTIEDRSAAELMTRFYRNLDGARSKADALRRAQMDFVTGRVDGDRRESLAHPYYWAPFFMVGDAASS